MVSNFSLLFTIRHRSRIRDPRVVACSETRRSTLSTYFRTDNHDFQYIRYVRETFVTLFEALKHGYGESMTHPVLYNSIRRPSTTLIDRVGYPVNVKVIAIVFPTKLRTDADSSGIIGHFVEPRLRYIGINRNDIYRVINLENLTNSDITKHGKNSTRGKK